jgi:hypothetical protein
MIRFCSSLLLCALFALILVSASGCASTESENDSTRPWNAPNGWENGIPSQMYQQGH